MIQLGCFRAPVAQVQRNRADALVIRDQPHAREQRNEAEQRDELEPNRHARRSTVARGDEHDDDG